MLKLLQSVTLIASVLAGAHCAANNTAPAFAPEISYKPCTQLPKTVDAKLVLSKSDFALLKKICTSKHAFERIQESTAPTLVKLRKILEAKTSTSVLLEIPSSPCESVVITILSHPQEPITKSYTRPQTTIAIQGPQKTLYAPLKTFTQACCAQKAHSRIASLGNFLGGGATIIGLVALATALRPSGATQQEPTTLKEPAKHDSTPSETPISRRVLDVEKPPAQKNREEVLSGEKLRKTFMRMLQEKCSQNLTNAPDRKFKYISFNAAGKQPRDTSLIYVILASELEGDMGKRKALCTNMAKGRINDLEHPFLWVSCLVLNDTQTLLTTDASKNDKNRKYFSYFSGIRGFGRTKIEIAQPTPPGNITRTKLATLLEGASNNRKPVSINHIVGISPPSTISPTLKRP